MRILGIFLLVLASAPAALAGSFYPLPGGCTVGASSDGWCRCEALDEFGAKHSLSLVCSILRCDQFRGYESNTDCPVPPKGTCVLAHPYYGANGAACLTDVVLNHRADGNLATPAEACSELLAQLNHPNGAPTTACSATELRGGWRLKAAY